MDIVGRADMPVSRAWQHGAEAYYGMAVPGYLNFFLIYGPNTNLGHNSIVFMIECQATYILGCLRRLLGGAGSIEVEAEAMARYQGQLEREIASTVWAAGCRSWYKTASGKVTNNWSGCTVQYWWRTKRSRLSDFRRT
jgi:cation diffusion facilitator CzcD-associated flavoprotein CzcO